MYFWSLYKTTSSVNGSSFFILVIPYDLYITIFNKCVLFSWAVCSWFVEMCIFHLVISFFYLTIYHVQITVLHLWFFKWHDLESERGVIQKKKKKNGSSADIGKRMLFLAETRGSKMERLPVVHGDQSIKYEQQKRWGGRRGRSFEKCTPVLTLIVAGVEVLPAPGIYFNWIRFFFSSDSPRRARKKINT